MKKAKVLLAVLLSASVIMLSGCSNILSVFVQNESDFYEITPLSSAAAQYISVDIFGDDILFLTFKETSALELTIYNVKKNKITLSRSLADCPLSNIDNAKFSNENEIIVYSNELQKGIAYDFQLNLKGEIDYFEENYYDSEPVTDFIDDRYDRRDTYSLLYDYNKKICIFNDEPDFIYITDWNADNILSDFHKMFLCCEYIEDSNNLKISVKDYDNAVCINDIETEKMQDGFFVNAALGTISSNYACFIYEITNENTGGVKQIPYLWKYTSNQKSTPLDIKKVTEENLNNENNDIIQNLNTKYGINVFVNKTSSDFGYTIEYNANALDVNLLLTGLSECLELFPVNFIKEIYEDYADAIDVYIVSHISEVNAYTFASEVTFDIRAFSKNIVFHEFMHMVANRLADYYANQNENLYDLWNQFNDENFFYGNDNADFDGKHFVSFYAMTNTDEDMAEIFQYLYETASSDGYPDCLNNEYVLKKAEFLCESIRKAFPSAAEEDKLYWEKHLDLNS